MGRLSPGGPVYQAGTLSGNPVATTAGLATLRLATDEVYAHIDEAARTLATAVTEALTRAGVPHVLQTGGNMFSVFLGVQADAVRDYATAATQDTAAYRAFFHAMLDQGVYLPPSAFEAWFLSAAHDDRALQHVIAALPAAAEAAARAALPGADTKSRAEGGLE
jgi:glutamate-1-semialdehyde 2,1-aminomutase